MPCSASSSSTRRARVRRVVGHRGQLAGAGDASVRRGARCCAHAEAHIERDECGAPEFFTGGAKLSLVGGAGAKIAAADLRARLDWFEPHVHGVQPRMLSITQATERGAIYTPAEIRALAKSRMTAA